MISRVSKDRSTSNGNSPVMLKNVSASPSGACACVTVDFWLAPKWAPSTSRLSLNCLAAWVARAA